MTNVLQFDQTLGNSIPPDTPHAISVSLPTWRSNVGYEEGEDWVLSKMKCGYPRFFVHPSIDRLAASIVSKFGSSSADKAMLFPSRRCGNHFVAFVKQQNPHLEDSKLRIFEFAQSQQQVSHSPSVSSLQIQPRVTAALYPKELWPTAKSFWQHTGEGISSRRADFCQRFFDEGHLVELNAGSSSPPRLTKGPRRYQRPMSTDQAQIMPSRKNSLGRSEETGINGAGVQDSAQFVEERFGRNLDVQFATQAKCAIKKRITGSLTADVDLPESLEQPTDDARARSKDVPNFSTDDVYLFSGGMNAIFTAHSCMRKIYTDRKSIMYGFPYVDTLKVLEKWGPGALFYGYGSSEELDDLESRLQDGERFLSLFCEFPGNPLLKSPDLQRLRSLADKYDFAVVVDETIGNFVNVHVLPYADIVVSSLTKVFSGDSNVMGGSMILNPQSRYYSELKHVLSEDYEDNQFEEDSIYLERNSRDFVSRIQRINHNAEAVADVLRAHPKVKQVMYPKYSPTKANYDQCKLADGGYGGLLSCTFNTLEQAATFYDHLDTQKGPSLGTNFTLSSPFVLLAHYAELDWAAQFGVEATLVRFSVGLEETETLKAVFERALAAIV
ncbi:PLP-dependent transferase [Polychaeton citri CBS 116435]|uniref:cystathionine gamma-synthase n=1 Tax=Polychaeton citri CBS 116435 TaxID=1314669 RepID=A0A9P4PX96_9PEZI|nr:PLP-dependent transferase [Polychaeton citri CBS 116435]